MAQFWECRNIFICCCTSWSWDTHWKYKDCIAIVASNAHQSGHCQASLLMDYITASQMIWWRTFWCRQKIQVRQWLNVDSKGLGLGIPKRGVPFLSAKNWPSYCLTSHASFWNWCLALAISLYGQCGTWTQSSSSLRCLRQCLTRFPCTLSPMAADHFDIHIFFRSQLDTVASIQFQSWVMIHNFLI